MLLAWLPASPAERREVVRTAKEIALTFSGIGMAKKITDVGEYIATAPEWARPTLRTLRRVIRAAAPRATESISYHMPYYALAGRLAYFSVHRAHCSFHWVSAEDKREFADALKRANLSGSTLHIPRGEKVPITLIRKLVKAHAKQNALRQKK